MPATVLTKPTLLSPNCTKPWQKPKRSTTNSQALRLCYTELSKGVDVLTEHYPAQELEQADIIRKVIELSMHGEPDEIGLPTARYTSRRENVQWILTRLISNQIHKCSAYIQYTDGTSYDISWQDGAVWSLT